MRAATVPEPVEGLKRSLSLRLLSLSKHRGAETVAELTVPEPVEGTWGNKIK